MVDVARITKVNLREIWASEATGFTPWLATNLAALGEALGMDLELVGQEAPVGSFAVDVLATETNTNRKVVIENQLETTNHDHMGKLLTYAAGYSADVVIWIARDFREEHRQTLDWLNERTGTQTEFFGVVVELLKIDNSRPAYNFDVVARPNQWQKSAVTTPENVPSEKKEAYREFFQSLIDNLREKHRFTNARAGQLQSWYSFSLGVSGVVYGASFAQAGRVRAEVYIDSGNSEENKRLFDALYARKDEFESDLGESLSWERLDGKRASRVAAYRQGRIDSAPEELRSIEDWLIGQLLLLKKVLGPVIGKESKSAAYRN